LYQIVVVDDELAILHSMKGVLEDEGYAVTLASDGTMALKESAGEVDAVVLDLMLPDMDGLEVLRRIKVQNAATNKDLEAEIRAERFREDLFWRLNVVPLHVPPCGTGKGTYGSCLNSSWKKGYQGMEGGRRASHPRPWPSWSSMPGRETCGN